MNNETVAGFTYLVEVVDAHGNVTDSETIHNLMPVEGLDHVLNVILKAGAPVTQWFIGVFDNLYTPTPNDTMALFPAQAGENVAYASATRPQFVPGAVAAGAVDNSAAKAEFAFSATKTIIGGFISSSSAKGSTSGTLLSAVRFGSAKAVDASSTLRITAGFTMASL
jgi:hypothetical protein